MKKFTNIFNLLDTKNKSIWILTFILNCFQTLIVNAVFGYGLKIGVDTILNGNLNNLIIVTLIVFVGGIYLIFVLPIIDYFMVKESYYAKKKLSDYSFDYVLKNKKSNFEHSISILDFIQNDTKEASHIFDWNFVVLFQAIISGIGALVIIAYYNMTMSVLCLIVGMLLFLMNHLAKKNLNTLTESKRSMWETLLKNLSDIIDNIKIIKVYSLSKFYRNYFNNRLKEYESQEQMLEYKKLNYQFLNDLLSDLFLYMIIICFGCKLVSENAITIGTVFLFLQLSVGITFLFQCIGDYFVNCSSILYAVNRIKKIFEIREESVEKDLNKFSYKSGTLECRNIFFGYCENKDILKNINLIINLGEILVINGGNGSGKTTLTKLLTNIRKDYRGEILLDGFLIKNMNQKDFIFYVGYVSQESYFIDGDLIENIELGYKNYDCEYLAELIEISHLNYLFRKKEVVIQEKGKNLSFGEKQRISFIRAMLRNPQIIVLDEFDANIETSLYLEILEYLIDRNKTIILIDHKNLDYGTLYIEKNVKIKHLNLGGLNDF